MPVYLNGKKYIGAYMNGHRVNGYINGKKMFNYNRIFFAKSINLNTYNSSPNDTDKYTFSAFTGEHLLVTFHIDRGSITNISCWSDNIIDIGNQNLSAGNNISFKYTITNADMDNSFNGKLDFNFGNINDGTTISNYSVYKLN